MQWQIRSRRDVLRRSGVSKERSWWRNAGQLGRGRQGKRRSSPPKRQQKLLLVRISIHGKFPTWERDWSWLRQLDCRLLSTDWKVHFVMFVVIELKFFILAFHKILSSFILGAIYLSY